MMKDAIERRLPHTIFLFYSNRRPEDAPFLDELETLATQTPSFRLIATMTEPEKSAKAWQGETGYINQAMLQRYVDDLEAPMYYIAGLSAMVKAMKRMLKDAGVKQENIRAEDFSGFKMRLMTTVPIAWKNHFALLAIGLMLIAAVILHATAAISIYSAFSLNNPISYLMIGAFFVFALFKLKHLMGFRRRKQRQSVLEISNGVSSTSGTQYEQR